VLSGLVPHPAELVLKRHDACETTAPKCEEGGGAL
jgi:hypothetical protein